MLLKNSLIISFVVCCFDVLKPFFVVCTLIMDVLLTFNSIKFNEVVFLTLIAIFRGLYVVIFTFKSMTYVFLKVLNVVFLIPLNQSKKKYSLSTFKSL